MSRKVTNLNRGAYQFQRDSFEAGINLPVRRMPGARKGKCAGLIIQPGECVGALPSLCGRIGLLSVLSCSRKIAMQADFILSGLARSITLLTSKPQTSLAALLCLTRLPLWC